MPGGTPETVAVAAGRLFLEQLAAARKSGEDVIVESTLSGKSFARQVEKFREEGYEVETLFITPLDVRDSVDRVSKRVRKGGHHVPEKDIRRRFLRAHSNFWSLYRPLSSLGWSVFVNETGKGHIHVATGFQDSLEIFHPVLFEEFDKLCYHLD